MSNVTTGTADVRLRQAAELFTRSGGALTFGLAVPVTGDTSQSLMARADAAMLDNRSHRPTPASP